MTPDPVDAGQDMGDYALRPSGLSPVARSQAKPAAAIATCAHGVQRFLLCHRCADAARCICDPCDPGECEYCEQRRENMA